MYHYYHEQYITDFSESSIEELYHNGYVFTRKGKGHMQQINSVRVTLGEFELSSENKRVLRRTGGVEFGYNYLPFTSYSWHIGRLAKDFYTNKFGKGIVSANKIKELFTDSERSNMNAVFTYSLPGGAIPFGYCISLITENIVHYSYPFYDISVNTPNAGIGMMLRAVMWAQEQGKKYIYLGSDKKYKHQFKGLVVFNGSTWSNK